MFRGLTLNYKRKDEIIMWRQPNETELNVLYIYGQHHKRQIAKAAAKHKILIRQVHIDEKHNNKAKISLIHDDRILIDIEDLIKIIPEEAENIKPNSTAYLVYIKPWYTPTIDNRSWLKRSYIVSQNFATTLTN